MQFFYYSYGLFFQKCIKKKVTFPNLIFGMWVDKAFKRRLEWQNMWAFIKMIASSEEDKIFYSLHLIG